jgi:hypothetical protein
MVIILGSVGAQSLGGGHHSRRAGAAPASPVHHRRAPLMPWHRICMHIAVGEHDDPAPHLLDAGGRRGRLPGGRSPPPPWTVWWCDHSAGGLTVTAQAEMGTRARREPTASAGAMSILANPREEGWCSTGGEMSLATVHTPLFARQEDPCVTPSSPL